MPIVDIPIFSMLRTRLQWHQERQKLLAENVANSDTPNFRPRDLTPLDFSQALARTQPNVTLARTEQTHLAGHSASSFGQIRNAGYEVRPAGNAVNLEDEMLKVSSNQMDYQAAASLYSRSLALFKTALGKR